MKKVFNYIILFILAISLTISPCYAGEAMDAGTVLQEDSYVFTVQEAQDLRIKMEELEKELKKRDKVIVQLKNLDTVQQAKEKELENTLELERSKILLYKELYTSSSDRLNKYERRRAGKDIGLVAISIVTTIALLLVVDSIDDHIDRTGPTLEDPSMQSRSGLIQIKF